MKYLAVCTFVSLVFKVFSASLDTDAFSDKPHFDGTGSHSHQYDHDAFLGEKTAKEFDKLSPEEAKERLREMFPKIDVDGNQLITKRELMDWMGINAKQHMKDEVGRKLEYMDKNNDGKVSWEEYVEVEHSSKGYEKKDQEYLDKLKKRDEKRWKFADRDSDKMLSKDELTLMVHPEEDDLMRTVLVQEHMTDMDANLDGVISFEEFAYPSSAEKAKHDKQTSEAFRYSFDVRDENRDGFWDSKELKSFILPDDGIYNPIEREAVHLMNDADKNKDSYLTLEEMLDSYETFVGDKEQNQDEGTKVLDAEELNSEHHAQFNEHSEEL